MEQDEGYDEPELIMFLTEWLDPWHGQVNEDDLWDFENNPTIDHLRMIMQTLESWVPVEENLSLDRSVLAAERATLECCIASGLDAALRMD